MKPIHNINNLLKISALTTCLAAIAFPALAIDREEGGYAGTTNEGHDTAFITS